ncbi:MAG TPA: DUF2334 domain-containing protein [Dissulfurispiraceae bacterium]
MPARYLIRFDDLCPTMNWRVWDEIEKLLVASGVKPILAVIPDNRDRALHFGDPNPDFWERVRKWQANGWTIGVHGYQHLYVTDNAGLVGINDKSEFAGLRPEEQEAKLRSALEIFRQQGIAPEAWIAPSHSFDEATVEALAGLGIRSISDGLFLSPHIDSFGMLWVPQQLWRFYPMPFGLWTVCFHHNTWKHGNIEYFRRKVKQYRDAICSFHEVSALYRRRTANVTDFLFGRMLLAALSAKRKIGGLVNKR